jgi:hypothetical protein
MWKLEKIVPQIALSGTLKEIAMVQCLQKITDSLNSPPVTRAPGFTPTLWFTPLGIWITTRSERSLLRDDVGALWPPWRRTHLPGDVAARSSPWLPPFPRSRHALGGLPRRFEPWRLTSDSRTPCLVNAMVERHGDSSPLLGRQRLSSKFGAATQSLYKLMP